MHKMKRWVVTYRAVRTAHEEVWIEKEVQNVGQKVSDAYARSEAKRILEGKYQSKNPIIQILYVKTFNPLYRWRWVASARVEATVLLSEEETVEVNSLTTFGARIRAKRKIERKGCLKDVSITSVDQIIRV